MSTTTGISAPTVVDDEPAIGTSKLQAAGILSRDMA